MLVQLWPESVETCHCTLGAGEPEAAALNETESPVGTSWPAGCCVTTGPPPTTPLTVSVAFVVSWVPSTFVNRARNSSPLRTGLARKLSVGDVAPARLLQLAPLLV